MALSKSYDNFPLWIVLVSNFVSITIYFLGIFVIATYSWLFAGIFLGYIAFLEFRLIKNHCVDCYYWGKTCGFGKGRISALLFKKGDIHHFCNHKITWKEMIPDMLVSLIPVTVGIIAMIIDFNFSILVAVIVIILLTTAGNGFIRGSLTCNYCKQREYGCPADKLFNPRKET
jgi:hypothetical protein